jgi:hypothetical protein
MQGDAATIKTASQVLKPNQVLVFFARGSVWLGGGGGLRQRFFWVSGCKATRLLQNCEPGAEIRPAFRFFRAGGWGSVAGREAGGERGACGNVFLASKATGKGMLLEIRVKYVQQEVIADRQVLGAS